MPSDIHEAANTTKEGWIAWFCPLKLYRHYSGCRIWSGLLYRNYIKLYVSFCAARPGFVAYLFVVQYTTAVLYRCFYIRFVLPLIPVRVSPHERDFFVFVNNMFYIKTSDLWKENYAFWQVLVYLPQPPCSPAVARTMTFWWNRFIPELRKPVLWQIRTVPWLSLSTISIPACWQALPRPEKIFIRTKGILK